MRVTAHDIADCAALLPLWQALATRVPGGIDSAGASNLPDWTASVAAMPAQRGEVAVWAVEDAGETVAIVPVERRARRSWGIPRVDIGLAQARYATRPRLLVREDDARVVGGVLDALRAVTPRWTTLTLSAVSGSANADAIGAALAARGCAHVVEQSAGSPYFALPATADALLAARDKKFRYLLRSAQKQLEAQGRLEFRVCRDDARQIIEWIYAIERASWKEAAGTSITRNPVQMAFYEDYLPKAAASGRLHCGVLLLDDEALAYNLGVVHNDVYECLKTTFKDAYRDASLGHLAYLRTMESLIARGVGWFDFQGVREASKSRWCDQDYTVSHFVIYGTGLAARAVHFSHRRRQRALPDATPAIDA